MSPRRYVLAVPARLESSRLPRKLLLAKTGRPLLSHVLENLQPLRDEADIWLITDHPDLAAVARDLADHTYVSRTPHASGSSRIAEALGDIEEPWVLNVQGDEPEVKPDDLRSLVARMESQTHAPMGTLAAPFQSEMQWRNPNAVKVLISASGRALYFSRSPLPHGGDHQGSHVLHHVGVYAYTRELLANWSKLPPSRLESAERLEQLRALDNDIPILVNKVSYAPKGIDTLEDYEMFVERVRSKNHG